MRQSVETTEERKTRAFLREKEGKVGLNIPVSPKGDPPTLDEAAAMIREDYAANGQRSADTPEYLLADFGGATRPARLTTGAVDRCKAARLARKAVLARSAVCNLSARAFRRRRRWR